MLGVEIEELTVRTILSVPYRSSGMASCSQELVDLLCKHRSIRETMRFVHSRSVDYSVVNVHTQVFRIRAAVVRNGVGRSYRVDPVSVDTPVLWVSAPGCGSVVDDWGNPNQLLCG